MKAFLTIPEIGDLYIGETFEWFDGPKLFSLTKKEENNPLYIAYWIGDKEDREVWMIIPVNIKRVNDYKSNKIDLYDFLNIHNEKNILRFDFIYGSINELNIMNIEEIKSIALPKKGLMHKRNI